MRRNMQADPDAAAMDAARAFGHAVGESPVFRRFEASQEAFQADQAAREKLAEFQEHQQKARMAGAWVGAGAQEEDEVEREWQSVSAIPSLSGYLRAQEELTALLREVTGKISDEIGVDYGAACAPSGGCC